MSFVASFIFPQALFFLMVMGALYLLALTLECLAVSTLKKQGDLFLGLMFGFVVLHFNYLWFYFLGRSRSA
ncbi:MAG: hypothetical protein B7C24_12115 [Bacteroidetes bacterium 4572_77]|nr:MAG: hypothetical protein B7C24_12115 [Bacteroidetes bacterium 4572_77]